MKSPSQQVIYHDDVDRFNMLNPFLGDEECFPVYNLSQCCGSVQHVKPIPWWWAILPITRHHNIVFELAVLSRYLDFLSAADHFALCLFLPALFLPIPTKDIILEQAPEKDRVEKSHEDQCRAHSQGMHNSAAVKVKVEPDNQQPQGNATEEEERDEVWVHDDAIEPVREGHPKHLQQLPAVEEGRVDLHEEGQDVRDDGNVEEQAVANDEEHLGKWTDQSTVILSTMKSSSNDEKFFQQWKVLPTMNCTWGNEQINQLLFFMRCKSQGLSISIMEKLKHGGALLRLVYHWVVSRDILAGTKIGGRGGGGIGRKWYPVLHCHLQNDLN